MKSAKWIVLGTAALGLSLSACTKAAESKEHAPAAQTQAISDGTGAPEATGAAAPAQVEAEGAARVTEDEATAAVEIGGAPGAADEAIEKADAPKPAKMAMKGAAPRGTAPVAAANVTVNKQYYTLEIKVPAAAAAGKPAEVVVSVVPKNGRHLNHEFPTKLVIEPPAGVSVAKPTLKKADATAFTDDLATFKVSFTSSDAGEKAFTGKFKFAVCTDATCDPMTEQLAFKVSVK